MCGLFQEFTPKFVKKYLSLADQIVNAFQTFDTEVKNRQYPSDEHAYHIKGDVSEFEKMFKDFD